MTGSEMYRILEDLDVVRLNYGEFMTLLNEKIEYLSEMAHWEWDNGRKENAKVYAKQLHRLKELYDAM